MRVVDDLCLLCDGVVYDDDNDLFVGENLERI